MKNNIKKIFLLIILSFSIVSFAKDLKNVITKKIIAGDTTAEPCSKTYCGCTPDGGDDKNCAADSKSVVNCEQYCGAAYGSDSQDSCTLSSCECTSSSYTTKDAQSCSITTPGPNNTPVTYVSNCGAFCCNYWGGCS